MPKPAPAAEDLVGLQFPYVGADEVVRFRIRPHLRLVVGEVLRSLVGALVAAFVLALLPTAFGLEGDAAAGAYSVVALAVVGPLALLVAERVLRAFLDVYFTEYVLTEHRVYSTTAFFQRRTQVVPFEKVTNLELHQGLFARLLGVWELRVVAYGLKGTEVRLRGIRDVLSLYRRVADDVRSHTSIEHLLSGD